MFDPCSIKIIKFSDASTFAFAILMIAWKPYEEETLIILVGKREGLWNLKHRDSVKKVELWDEVTKF